MFLLFRPYYNFLNRNKLYTFVSITGFAVSIMFVIVLLVYARTEASMDSFHEKKERIYLLTHDNRAGVSNPVAEYVKGLCPEVETYTRIVNRPMPVKINEDEWFEGMTMFADRDFFNIFSFPLLSGDPDRVLAAENSAVLSRSTALRIFGEDDPLGKTINIIDKELTVTGVMDDFPYNTHFVAPDLVIPYPLIRFYYGNASTLDHWGMSNFMTYFLSVENGDLPSRSEIIKDAFKKDYWLYSGGFTDDVHFLPLENIFFAAPEHYETQIKTGSLDTTRIYTGIAFLVLLIALLNYVNMTSAQILTRGREVAVKKLTGSTKGRLFCQIIVECILMTMVSVVLAFLLALIAEPVFNGVLDTRLGIIGHLTFKTAVFSLLAILFISLLAGIIPATMFSSFDTLEVMKGSYRRVIRTGYAKWLIIMQLAVCTILLASTILMYRQIDYLMGRDVGFNRENILLITNEIEKEGLPALRDRLLQVPGVKKVGFAMGSPFDANNNSFVMEDGRTVSMTVLAGDSVCFDIFGMKVTPTLASTVQEQSTTVYLNRSAFNAVRPDSATMSFTGWTDDAVVAGILEDINVESLRQSVEPTLFFFLEEDQWPWEVVVELESGDIYRTASEAVEIFRQMSGLGVVEWYFADERIYEWYENERRMSSVMASFTLLSIVIMVMGVFAMSVYMIRQKEKEIGVRKVSGATVGEILRMLNLQSLGRVGVAFVIACPVAWYGIDRWLREFAYRIDIGAGAFVAAGLIVTLLCLASVSWQTFRAARANPVESLKSE